MAEALVRRATVDDAPGIVELGLVVVPATYGPLAPAYAAWCLDRWWSPDEVAGSLATLPHWVAVDGGRVVGVANLGEMAGDAVMWKLYVHPDHHRRGLGAALLAKVEQGAGPRLRLEHLGSNDRASAFYEAQGFTSTHTTVIEQFPDLTWVWREKVLGDPVSPA